GARSTTSSTAARLFSPAPALMVSSTWDSNVSPSSSTAAMPPCAQAVEPADISPLETTATLQVAARSSASVRPAAPEPMTRTSKVYRSSRDMQRRLLLGGGLGQPEEHVLQVRLLRRHILDAAAAGGQRRQHLPRIGAALVIRNGDAAAAAQFRVERSQNLGHRIQIAVDGHHHHLVVRLRHEGVLGLVGDHLPLI